jgi:sulfonate transport system substrate-binding protein
MPASASRFIPRLLIMTVALCLVACDRAPDRLSKTEPTPLTVAASKYIGSAPVFVAHKLGFFQEQGLDVELIINNAGVEDFQDLLRGDAQIAMVAELPLVYSAFDKRKYTDEEREDFVIIADMVLANNISQVLVRTDRGIESPDDIRGKTVAVPMGTSIDFLLDLFLTTHGIDRSEITLKDMDVLSQVEAIVQGDVDAVFAWQPHVGEADLRLGELGRILPLNLFYHNAWLAVSMKDFAGRQPEVLERFLRALLKAEEYLLSQPDLAIAIHAEYARMEPEVIARVWNDVTFWISLSEGLLTTMEDQARWIIRNGWADTTAVPNFHEYLDIGPLNRVNPERLTIIQ